jgi:hypothetical protein
MSRTLIRPRMASLLHNHSREARKKPWAKHPYFKPHITTYMFSILSDRIVSAPPFTRPWSSITDQHVGSFSSESWKGNLSCGEISLHLDSTNRQDSVVSSHIFAPHRNAGVRPDSTSEVDCGFSHVDRPLAITPEPFPSIWRGSGPQTA